MPPAVATDHGPAGAEAGAGADVGATIRPLLDFFRRVMQLSAVRQLQQFNSSDPIIKAFERAATQNPDAEIDAGLLRELTGFLTNRSVAVQFVALSSWCRLLTKCLPSTAKRRAMVLLGVDGAVASLEDMLKDTTMSFVGSAAAALCTLCMDAELRGKLATSAVQDLYNTSLAALVQILPQAAAAEVGLPAVVIDTELPPSPALPQVISNLLLLLSRLAMEFGLPGREAMSPPRETIPALVAVMAAPEIDVTQLAAMALGTLLSSCPRPELAARCFWLGERGLVRGLRRCFEEDLRQLRARCGPCGDEDPEFQTYELPPPPPRAAGRPLNSLIDAASIVLRAANHLKRNPKRLLDRPCAAWDAVGSGMGQLLRNLDAPGMPLEEDERGAVHKAMQAVVWVCRWRLPSLALCADAGTLEPPAPEPEPAAEAAPAAAPSSQRRQRGARARRPVERVDGGAAAGEQADPRPVLPSLPVVRRRCAVCCKTRADGAHLRRCRGCGDVTGVMYCGEACAREHWVKKGHRALCDKGRAALREMREEEATVLWQRDG